MASFRRFICAKRSLLTDVLTGVVESDKALFVRGCRTSLAKHCPIHFIIILLIIILFIIIPSKTKRRKKQGIPQTKRPFLSSSAKPALDMRFRSPDPRGCLAWSKYMNSRHVSGTRRLQDVQKQPFVICRPCSRMRSQRRLLNMAVQHRSHTLAQNSFSTSFKQMSQRCNSN